MLPQQRLITAILLMLLLVIVLRLVRRQQLGVTLGLVWTGLLVAALVILAIPGLLEGLTALTGAKFPVSAVTLLALVVISLFFFYFSIVIHKLERKHVQLVRTIALMEHRLRSDSTASHSS